MTILKLGEHLPKFGFIENPYSELFRLFQFAARFVASQDVARLFAHAAAHFSAASANQFGDFIARLTERAGDDPGRVFKSRRRAFDFWFRVEAQTRLPQFLDDREVVRLAKKFVDAAPDDFPDIGDLLQFLHRTRGDRVKIWKM